MTRWRPLIGRLTAHHVGLLADRAGPHVPRQLRPRRVQPHEHSVARAQAQAYKVELQTKVRVDFTNYAIEALDMIFNVF